MRWSDEAVVLSARRHGESALLVHLLTHEHGRHAGLVRGGQRPKTRGTFEIGNRLTVAWSARLSEHLGMLQGELVKSHAALLIDAPLRLACLAAAAALADAALPEREPHGRVFLALAALLDALDADRGWLPAYVAWELDLLAELGFGLDLASCAATGVATDLIYVSPNSGRAVSAAAGEPYRERLFALPPFLRVGAPAMAPTLDDVVAGLALAGHFLDARVFAPHQRAVPAARGRFIDLVGRHATLGAA